MNDDYPAFRKWYVILDWILDRCETFPKSVRFTFSGRIANLALDILEQLIEAIYSKDKKAQLAQINMNLEKLRVSYRLSFNRKYISGRQFEFIVTELNEFGKMIGGWLKSAQGK
ncbi:MAG: diversity-generating retroelement protein Avd [Spirochaetes bacterium]|nr:diversity-generating retroelement protein Avd [Spirochaetota bacterium]